MFKKWILVFCLCLACFAGIMGFINYKIDPLGYWASNRGKWDHCSTSYNAMSSRQVKSNYILRKGSQYEAVVFGGSNAGTIDPELIEQITGYKTYNYWNSNGDSQDYLELTKFCIKQMPKLKQVIVQISNEEFHAAEKIPALKLPYYVTGESPIKEKLSYIFINPYENVRLWIKKHHSRPNTVAEQTWIPKENLHLLGVEECLTNGKVALFYHQVPDDLMYDYVVNKTKMGGSDDLKSATKVLFEETERDFKTFNVSIENLKKIKELCDANDVELTVFVGACFINKKARFEGEQYYEWLKQLADITPFWDFSGFFDANLNPFNFYNAFHYNYETADEIIKIIYGKKQNQDFGFYVTRQNVFDYIESRRLSFARLKQEYEQTGTVHLFGKDDKSFLGKE